RGGLFLLGKSRMRAWIRRRRLARGGTGSDAPASRAKCGLATPGGVSLMGNALHAVAPNPSRSTKLLGATAWSALLPQSVNLPSCRFRRSGSAHHKAAVRSLELSLFHAGFPPA